LRQKREIMKNVNDHFYIRQVKAGNTRAFAGIVSGYSPMILTLITRMTGSREDAEDIAQEVFIKVYKSLDQFKEESEFATWLYRIAYNTTISELRKRKVHHIPIEDNLNADEESDEDDELLELKHQYLDKALKQLPADEVFMINLYYIDDKPVRSISEITGMTESNVKTKLFRARKKLAVEINRLMKQQDEQ